MLDPYNTCSLLPSPLDTVRDVDEAKLPVWSPQQRYTVQTIQLVEGPPPPRRLATTNPSIASSSSYGSSFASESSGIDDDGSVCSSYCSSDADADVAHLRTDLAEHLRVRRVLAWRENFSGHFPSMADAALIVTSLKRKPDYLNSEFDWGSFTRSSANTSSSKTSSTCSALRALSCPACDSFFDDQSSLREHGQEEGASEACTAAVQYAFESPAHTQAL